MTAEVATGISRVATGARSPAIDAEFTVAVSRGGSSFRVEVKLELEAGVLVLFGPSGSGKSLTLQAVVGTVQAERGHLRIGGRTLFDTASGEWLAAHRRAIGYVPQHHSLFPFCNVAENVAFGLPRERRKGRDPEVEAIIEEMGLARLRDAMPRSLSGGERQRVALARALAVQPRLLVLDEPFASIDVQGRTELRRTLAQTLERRDLPAIFVTHDPLEAVELGDRVARFERGKVVAHEHPRVLLPLVRSAYSLMDGD